MKKILSGIMLLILSSSITNRLQAQNISISQEGITPKYTLAVQPFVLSNGGLRLDFERQLHHPHHWLQLGITGYHLPEISAEEDRVHFAGYDNEIKGLKGVGIHGSYKLFLPSTWESFYTMGNLSYTFQQVKYMDTGYHSFIDDGMKYYEYSTIMQSQKFNRMGINAFIGFQSPLIKNIFLDFYAGIGYAVSLYDKNKKHFDTSILDYGHNGITIGGGVRIGVAFGK